MIDVVGVTEAGWAALGEPERAIVTAARVIMGGARHLAMLPDEVPGQRVPWPSALLDALPGLLDHAKPAQGGVVVLASGDPTLSGIGSTLLALLGADQVRQHPATSSAVLARAAMGWPAEASQVVTLVGRDANLIRPHLTPGAALIVLGAEGEIGARLGQILEAEGAGAVTIDRWGHLGGPRQSHERLTGQQLASATQPGPELAVLAITLPEQFVPEAGLAGAYGTSPGLPDQAFTSDGQMTKRVVRAAALAHLRPTPGALLWDLGAGTGTIALEWARHHPTCQAICVEQSPERVAQIEVNAANLGVPQVQTRCADLAATDLLDELPEPHAIFIGGGLTEQLWEYAHSRLAPCGRLVAHSVTLESDALLTQLHVRYGGELTRISVESAAPLGSVNGWRPARTITQLATLKDIS